MGQVTKKGELRSFRALKTPTWRLNLSLNDLQSKHMEAKDALLEKVWTIKVTVEGYLN